MSWIFRNSAAAVDDDDDDVVISADIGPKAAAPHSALVLIGAAAFVEAAKATSYLIMDEH